MSDRKHVTIRFFQVPLQFDGDEQAYGTTLLALPANTEVSVLDVNPLGQGFMANVSLVSAQEVTDEELEQIEASIEQAQNAEQAEAEGATPVGEDQSGIIATPAVSIEQHRQNRAARKKGGKPAPVSG